MWLSFVTRLLGGRQLASARRAPRVRLCPTVRTCSLFLEVLEDRTVPSGGPGPSVLTDPGGGTGPSGALVSTSGGPGSSASGSSSGGPAQTTQQAQGAAAPSQAVVNYLNQLLSKLFPGGPGYPLPPSVGPTQTGSLLDPSIVSALPVSLQQSAVAVVPLMLYGGDTSVISTVTPPAGYTAVVVTVSSGPDTAMYLVVIPVSTAAVPAPNSGAPAAC